MAGKRGLRVCLAGDAGSIHLSRLSKSLAENGIDVSLVTIGRHDDIPGVKKYELPALNHGRTLAYPILFRRKIRSIAPDLVHAHYVPEYGFYSRFARVRPLIVHAWGSDIYVYPKLSAWAKMKTRSALKSAELVMADAQDLANAITKFGVDRNRIRVIPFGVNLDVFSTSKSVDPRRKLGLFGKKIVISTRSLSPLYGVEYLVEAAPRVIARHQDVHFVIVGKGPLEDELRQLARSRGVERNFTFTGYLPHEKMADLLRSADVYVSTSLTDSTSVSLLEAMSCGLPAVVTDLAGNTEWIRDNENGIVVPASDAAALAEAVTKLVGDHELRRRLGQNARKVIEERADWKKNVAEIIGIYESLVR